MDSTDFENMFLDFTGVHTKIPMPKLFEVNDTPELIDSTVSSPYIIHMKFKLARAATSSLFSIEEGSAVTMMLQLEPAGPGFMRIILVVPSTEEISFYVPIKADTWADVLLYVKDEDVIVYNDCLYQDEKGVTGKKSIAFSNDSFLVLGKTARYSAFEEFEVRFCIFFNFKFLNVIVLKVLVR